MDIEDFFKQIDSDLLEYVPAFRKLGFTSSQTMKYWREHDFQSLDVDVPEGQRRLILNMTTKLRTPEVKSTQHTSSLSKKIYDSPEKNNPRSRRDISSMFAANPSTSKSTVSTNRTLDLVSPVERYIRNKEDELSAKTDELTQKKRELETMSDRIKEAASVTGQTGQKCSNCHQRSHTVRSCKEDKCDSAFFCGDLSKHTNEKFAFPGKKRAIVALETSVKKMKQDLTARQTAFSRVTNAVNKNVEEILVEEFPNDYVENGVRDWLKIQQDVAFVKKNFRRGSLPSREMVKTLMEQKYQDNVLQLNSSKPKRQRSSAIESKLASYGVQFPSKEERRRLSYGDEFT